MKRITSVTIVCLSAVCFLYIMADHRRREEVDFIKWLGLSFNGNIAFAVANTLMLNSILFFGEMVQIFLGMQPIQYTEINLLVFKNLVLAPVFEELIYRACLINIFVEANIISLNKCIYILPIFFAVSHIHLYWKQRKDLKNDKKMLLFSLLFKTSYTQVFGMYAGYIYVHTGSLWAAIALHAQCNFFGFPALGNLFDEDISLTKRNNNLSIFPHNQSPPSLEGRSNSGSSSSPEESASDLRQSNTNNKILPEQQRQSQSSNIVTEKDDYQAVQANQMIGQKSEIEEEQPFLVNLMSFAALFATQVCWYSPFAASKQISNAYGLKYIELNIVSFYTNLALQAALAFPVGIIMVKQNTQERKILFAALALAIAGCFLKAVSVAGGEYGTFWVFGLGQTFIGIALIPWLINCLKVSHSQSNTLMAGYLLNLFVLSQFGAIFFTQFLYQAIFTRDDSFFYNYASAHSKIVGYTIVQAFLLIVAGIGKWFIERKYKLMVKPIQMRSVVDANQIIKNELKKGTTWLLIISFGFINAAFFLQFMKWNHIVNQFCFTQSDAEFFCNLFIFGALINCCVFQHCSWLHSKFPKVSLLVYLVIAAASIGVMTGTLTKADPNLTTFLAFCIGFAIASWYNSNLSLGFQVMNKSQTSLEGKQICSSLALAVGGALGAVITVIGDKIHYMNRDITTFVYVAEGIVAGLLLFAFVLMMILTRNL